MAPATHSWVTHFTRLPQTSGQLQGRRKRADRERGRQTDRRRYLDVEERRKDEEVWEEEMNRMVTMVTRNWCVLQCTVYVQGLFLPSQLIQVSNILYKQIFGCFQEFVDTKQW